LDDHAFVKAAQRPVHAIPHLAEHRSPHFHLSAVAMEAEDDLAARIGGAGDLAGQAEGGAQAHAQRQDAQPAFAGPAEAVERPHRGQLAGAAGDVVIRLRRVLAAQETERGRERRGADHAAFLEQAERLEPVLVELQLQRDRFGDRLMQACDHEPANFRFAHFLITLSSSATLSASHQRAMTEDAAVSAAILAGGRARRMQGLDKSALDVGGRSILSRQINVLQALTPELLIVGDPARFAGPIAGAGAGLPRGDVAGVRVVPDRVADAGPLGGLYTALLETAAPLVVLVACDMPFLTLAFLQHLVARAQDEHAEVAVPRTGDRYHPLCAAYARTLLPRVADRVARRDLEMTGLIRETRRVEIGPDELARFDPEALMLCNVNTPHDYRQAVSRAINR
jgi:molybdenum cofactor guanylyltransferase